MPLYWLQTITTNAPERRLAIIIASIATLAVAASLVWTLFFDTHDEIVEVVKLPTTVQVTEKPQSIPSREQLKIKANKSPASEKPTVKKQVTKKQVVIGKGNLYVQVGAFKQPNLARLTYDKMQKKYKRAKIILRSGNYAVWVGPVVTRKEADELKKHIQRRDNINGFIISDK